MKACIAMSALPLLGCAAGSAAAKRAADVLEGCVRQTPARPTKRAAGGSKRLIMVGPIVVIALLPHAPAWAQRCDPSVPGNAMFSNPASCNVRAAERDGIIIGIPANSKRRVDPAKVPKCTAIGAELMKRMSVAQKDFIATAAFASTFTFAGRCARLSLECQVLETGNAPELNRLPWGTVSMTCGASADRYTEALRIIAPSVPAGKVKPFVARCLTDAKAGKGEGPEDLEIGSYVLTCDPQHPEGPQVTVQPATAQVDGAATQRRAP